MKETAITCRSEALGREMTCAVYGDAGRLCLVFPTRNGRYFDFHNFGMVDAVRPAIEAGRLRLACVDSIDAESWFNTQSPPRQRIERHERWHRYVVDELLPALGPLDGGKAIACGCDMGGFHAGCFFFRRPDLFDAMLSLSGLFNARAFFGETTDDLIYANSPASFLPNMPDDHPWMALYRSGRIIACVGQGEGEDAMLAGTAELDGILSARGIPHWVDYWGRDVSHDWSWWQKQLPYFIAAILTREPEARDGVSQGG